MTGVGQESDLFYSTAASEVYISGTYFVYTWVQTTPST